MELTSLDKDIQDALSISKGISINNNDDEKYALEFCKVIKRCQDDVGKEYDPTVDSAYTTYKIAYNKRASYLDPLKEAEKLIKQLIKNYRLMLENKRLEEERLAQERMDKAVKEEQEKLMKQAEEAHAKGDQETANKLAVQSVSIESGGVFVEGKSVKQEGMSSSIVWKARVVDLNSLPIEFIVISPNQKAIDNHVKLYGKDKPIRGVEYYQDVNLSVRK